MQEVAGMELPLEWYVPQDLECQYATNLVVQHTGHEYIISFFRAEPPLILGTPEEVMAQLAQVDSVQAKCVARIIVSPGRMPAFVEVLRRNLENTAAGSEDIGE